MENTNDKPGLKEMIDATKTRLGDVEAELYPGFIMKRWSRWEKFRLLFKREQRVADVGRDGRPCVVFFKTLGPVVYLLRCEYAIPDNFLKTDL